MNKIRRSKKLYEEYVCPKCFNQLNKCVCKFYPPRDLINIDKDIQEHIRILNQKGYKTENCCAGHLYSYKKSITEIYIDFVNWAELPNIPDGFKKDKNRNIIRHLFITRNLTDEEFERERQNKLDNLLKWCNELPEFNRNK